MTLKQISYIFKISILIFFLTNCKNTEELKVNKFDNTNVYSDNSILYALPLTVLRLDFEIIEETTIPGPYCIYAEKYIGIKNAPIQETTKWEINNINIESYNEIDPSELYIFEPVGKFKINIDNLKKNGILIPLNSRIYTEYKTNKNIVKKKHSDILFTDLSSSIYVGYEKNTYFKRVKKDSLYAKIPITETRLVNKSLKEKAEEAAAIIMTIRKRRIELLTGYADFFPNGNSLETNLKELKRIEDNYVSLFIGKKLKTKYNKSYEYTPMIKNINKQIVLFRFSDSKGIVQESELNGRDIKISLEKTGITNEINNFFADKINRIGANYKNKLYYRIPDNSIIKIFDDKTEIANCKFKVEQFGVTIPFPAKFLTDDESFIEFYKNEKK